MLKILHLTHKYNVSEGGKIYFTLEYVGYICNFIIIEKGKSKK